MSSSVWSSSSISSSTISWIWSRNHGSILVRRCTSSSVKPCSNASPTYQMRSGPGLAELLLERLAVAACVWFRPSTPTSRPRSAFWNDSWKVRPIAITSPTDFICVVRRSFGLREFLEGEARHLGDDVVDGRLERGRRRAAGDLVAQLVERVAHRELGRDLGDREAGGLGRQRARSATRAGSSRSRPCARPAG